MDDLDRYLARLDVAAAPPSVEALFALHRAHVERIPYETTWIHLGETWDLDVDAAVRRFARHGRGGYCYFLNGALASLLSHLGYAVTRHVGAVHESGQLSESNFTNHLALTVAGLPNETNPDGRWYVDTGLGDALHEPLPLVAGSYRQGPFTFGLQPAPDELGDWRFTHDPSGSFDQMTFRMAPATMAEFAGRHRFLSTSPESRFVGTVTAQRRDATGCDVLRGLMLSRVGEDQTARVLDQRDDWFAALDSVFGLRLDSATEAARDQLWARVVAGHESWARREA